MDHDNKSTLVAGLYLDAVMATKQTLEKSLDQQAQLVAKDFKAIDLTLDEHRVMVAIFGIYQAHPNGYDDSTFQAGVTLTPYELSKNMDFGPSTHSKIGGKAIQQTIRALVGLSRKTFTIYFKKFCRMDANGNKYYTVVVNPSCPLLQIIYESSNVTEDELVKGDFEKKASKIHIKILPIFYRHNYYALFHGHFYRTLKSVLPTGRVSKYHYIFALWLLKQKRCGSASGRAIEINVDKLILILKIPCDISHASRARRLVRKLYTDLKLVGYVKEYRIDVAACNGKRKDVLKI